MPRTKQQNEAIRAEKRQLIIDTALHLFANKGFSATSISDIAKSANISKGLMYNYFESKEDVLYSIWEGLLEEFIQMIDPNLDGEVTQTEAENFIDQLFEMFIKRREEMRLYYQSGFQPEVFEIIRDKFDMNRVNERQNLIIHFFAGKLSGIDPVNAHFSILVFLKGLGLLLTYTDYDASFLDNYKSFLKSFIQ